MAEVVAKIVLGKLAKIIEKKIELLGGVGDNVKQVQRELTRIKCFLKDADSKLKGDERAQNWLNELRDVAYRIEDATDTFFLEVEVHRQKDPSFLQKLKMRCHKPMEVPILHMLGKKLEHIQNVLEEIFKSRVHYGITDLQDKSKGEEDRMSIRRATYPEVDETEVVGLQTDINNIMKMLRSEEVPRRAVITIVGTGGLGKTTLAHMVYKSAKAYFDCHMMLSISQQFSRANLLRKMLRKLKGSVTENHDVEDLISELRIFLSSKRYLIVLDDVWSVDLWKQMIDALPDKKNGSRVLITSRYVDVAMSADPTMKPYELNFLNDEESLDLLLKKALLNKLDEECSSDLVDVADQLSKKCKGLPLALLVVGGILSTKEQSIHVWKTVLQTLEWHTKGKDCMQVLAMSYEDMPYYLKACFLYLACFPEDYEISVKRLIRMWVAEEFIPCEGRITMEQKAEDCIQELFQRSMVMVSSRRTNGLIKCFNVHDLLRDLAIHEAGKLNFCTIFSQASNHIEHSSGIRRASVFRNPLLMESVNENTRSLLLFEIRFRKVFNFRLLKVLELVGVTYFDRDPSGQGGIKIFDKLIHLKYLGMRYCKMDISYSLDRLQSLETLDIRGDRFSEQTVDGIWAISTLRHVLWNCDVYGPTSTDNLKNLQTMRWIKVPKTWDTELPRLDNLCKLGLRKYYHDSATWVSVTKLFQTLPSLVSLAIEAHSLPVEIVYPKALPNYQNLQSLYLNGAWSLTVNLEASLFPPLLMKLTLIDSKLKQNPMSELGKLRNLKKLCLKRNVFNYSSPTICPIGFPVLQYLVMGDWLIKDLTVAKGVMQKLRYLQATRNIKLHLPPELEHVTINFLNYYF